MTRPVVFLGPSLPRDKAAELLEAEYLPPVKQGDVYRALDLSPSAFGIVDGYFEGYPSVWHKEILYALEQGVPSLWRRQHGRIARSRVGRLRHDRGGEIYAAYRDGVYEDDDEVAVQHGPAELGYPALTMPMADIRATVAARKMRASWLRKSGRRLSCRRRRCSTSNETGARFWRAPAFRR